MINLSIIIPIYKEGKNIKALINQITKNINVNDYEILFIDDNSEDGTEEILKEINILNKKVKYIIRKEKKKDLSKSCILGFENSKYSNILVMDGDLQHDPNDISKLIKTFSEKNFDLVVGSRNLFNKKNEGLPFYRLASSKILIILISIFLGKKTEDPMSGFFLFKKEIYLLRKEHLYARGYKILLDLIYFTKKELKIADVDINFQSRAKGKSKMSIKIIFLVILIIVRKFFSRIKLGMS
tara:strand:- start:2979 stop:3698 length:720 start_codon:yes stop_codon:yes gene_type:complete